MNKDLVLVLVESAKNAMPAGMTPDKWIEMYNERLVELVVRECMELNNKELSILAVERLLPLYKEHFGV